MMAGLCLAPRGLHYRRVVFAYALRDSEIGKRPYSPLEIHRFSETAERSSRTMTEQPAIAPSPAEVGNIIRHFAETLRKTQFLPPEKMRDYQRGLLERLLRHARATVPFYRDSGRLDPLFRGDGTIDWDRWSEVPPLTRTDVQESANDLVSELIPEAHGKRYVIATSGSTGEPVKVLQTSLAARWAWTAQRLRDFDWHGTDPTQRLAFLYPYTPDDFDITDVRRRPAWRSELAAFNLIGERIEIADTRPAADLVEAVVSVQPTYLQAQPTALQLMVACDSKRRLADLKLAAVFTYGEHFPAESKRAIEDYLGCKVHELYGSAECNYIATSCPACGNFHVQAEMALVETVDEEGGVVAPGETGRLLVTPFYNYGMPLIRYDHADFAEVAHNTCRITLPALGAIFGKKREPFVFPGGRTMRPTLPSDAVTDLLGARMLQVAQVAEDRCELRIVPGSLAPAEMKFDEMTELLRAIWWEGLQIDYRIVDAFPRPTPRAKFQPFVQEFSRS
jgi:phenylacetate-CoA ligase